MSRSPLAARLAAFVARAPSSRIIREQMWSALAADTSLLGADDSRARLREAFYRLERERRLTANPLRTTPCQEWVGRELLRTVDLAKV